MFVAERPGGSDGEEQMVPEAGFVLVAGVYALTTRVWALASWRKCLMVSTPVDVFEKAMTSGTRIVFGPSRARQAARGIAS
jgi:hypothetical protein